MWGRLGAEIHLAKTSQSQRNRLEDMSINQVKYRLPLKMTVMGWLGCYCRRELEFAG